MHKRLYVVDTAPSRQPRTVTEMSWVARCGLGSVRPPADNRPMRPKWKALLALAGVLLLAVALSPVLPWILLGLALPGSFVPTLWEIGVRQILQRQHVETTYEMRMIAAFVASVGLYFLGWYLLSRCFERKLWAVLALFGTLAAVLALNVWASMYELGWTR